jgi:hypothetical protein
MKRLLWLILLILAAGSCVLAQTPGFVQHSDESLTWGYNGINVKNYTVSLPQPTQTGNVVIVNVGIGVSATPSGLKVTDDASTSNTYTLLNSIGSSQTGNYVAQFCGAQTNSAQRFTVSATSDLGSDYVKASATEFYNVAAGSGGCTSADQTWTNNEQTASTTVNCGTGTNTTSTANDLIHLFAWNTAAPPDR